MDPVWTSVQAWLVGLAVVFVSIFGDDQTATCVGSVSAACGVAGLLLVMCYSLMLDGRNRSAQRARDDRTMTLWCPAPLWVSFVISVMSAHSSDLPVHRLFRWGHVASVVMCTVVGALAVILLSSLLDRYVVLPWRDGVLDGRPAFRRGERSRDVCTHLWFIHRVVATVVTFAGFWAVVGLAWFAVSSRASNNDWGLYLAGLVSPSAIPVFLMRKWLQELWHATNLAFGHIDVFVGDTVLRVVNGVQQEGVVIEASVDRGMTVLAPDGSQWTMSLKDVRLGNGMSTSISPPAQWNMDTVFGAASRVGTAADFTRQRTRPSRRLLVL